jgi:aldehyde dehydrogenase (NAD+)
MTSLGTDTRILSGEERMLIGGELQHAAGGAKFRVIHPGTEEVVGQVTDATIADMERAGEPPACIRLDRLVP